MRCPWAPARRGPEPDVDLEWNDRAREHHVELDPEAVVLVGGTNRLDRHRIEPVLEPVSLIGDRADLAERLGQRDHVIRPVSGEVNIARWPRGGEVPQHEQHRSFEHEIAAVRRNAKAVEKPFGDVPVERQLEVAIAAFGIVQQARAHRGGEVGDSLRHARTASR
jgi:hypothetical protein